MPKNMKSETLRLVGVVHGKPSWPDPPRRNGIKRYPFLLKIHQPFCGPGAPIEFSSFQFAVVLRKPSHHLRIGFLHEVLARNPIFHCLRQIWLL
jgi:hypothetical protein